MALGAGFGFGGARGGALAAGDFPAGDFGGGGGGGGGALGGPPGLGGGGAALGAGAGAAGAAAGGPDWHWALRRGAFGQTRERRVSRAARSFGLSYARAHARCGSRRRAMPVRGFVCACAHLLRLLQEGGCPTRHGGPPRALLEALARVDRCHQCRVHGDIPCRRLWSRVWEGEERQRAPRQAWALLNSSLSLSSGQRALAPPQQKAKRRKSVVTRATSGRGGAAAPLRVR